MGPTSPPPSFISLSSTPHLSPPIKTPQPLCAAAHPRAGAALRHDRPPRAAGDQLALPRAAAEEEQLVSVQAAVVVAGHVPGGGLAPAEGGEQEPPPEEQERDRRGPRRAQGLHRARLRVRFAGGRPSPQRHPAGAGALLRRQQALLRRRFQVRFVSADGVRLRNDAVACRQPPQHLRSRGKSSDDEDKAETVGTGGGVFGAAVLLKMTTFPD